ncbi:hypothetical protein HH310_01000 [Actinoplanes sp. TBRC 11911]|uniref:hypothetical protein n=1 Tax=Actinoplanes sp. TBRC 11911 TaxID=2729386 RepID=UPI00145D4CA5|nr:hypothetical protein [Actinoplanes sp. TBRC 11911]NMO49778.1 hypothetical protein [Actinoplanes sp. TBRC 11911]
MSAAVAMLRGFARRGSATAIAKTLIDAHRQRIWEESGPGGGTLRFAQRVVSREA